MELPLQTDQDAFIRGIGTQLCRELFPQKPGPKAEPNEEAVTPGELFAESGIE